MANLKAGTLTTPDGFADSMAAAIEQAMRDEWLLVKGRELPLPQGEEDRRILFAAISQGILSYLHAKRADIATNTQNDTTEGHSHTLSFDIE